ncbi:tannase/feruloyl esterase family alpha/beta hydrolase [Bradyrhizobium liaoningense]
MRLITHSLVSAFACFFLANASEKAFSAPAECSLESLRALAPSDVRIAEVNWRDTESLCFVAGSVKTTGQGAPDGNALFQLRLPSGWNGKFLFVGVGGLAGGLFENNLSANGTDIAVAAADHYAVAITDQGHTASGLDAAWALSAPGRPNEAKLADYYFRATHIVTIAAKAITKGYFDAEIKRSYFDGCSNGGRQGMVEATRFPEDYDGIIAGAPFFDISSMLPIMKFQKQQLSDVRAHMPAAMLPKIDKAVRASCDALDGVRDGLVQNPAACGFDPATMICRAGSEADCLTPEQATSLRTYFTAVHDENGRLVYPGYSPTDMEGQFALFMGGNTPPIDINAAEPWGNKGFAPAPLEWSFSDHIVQHIVMRNPDFNVREFGVNTDGRVKSEDLALFLARTQAGNGSQLDAINAFLGAGRKLILYHGMSDHALSPFRTVRYYEDLAKHRGGYDELKKSARFFAVPGMQHCRGGPGPSRFDTLSALDAWIEKGTPPEAINAATPVSSPSQSGSEARAMPLCSYPTMAAYDGSGPVKDATSWSCKSNDKMLEIGPVGLAAGLRTASTVTP